MDLPAPEDADFPPLIAPFRLREREDAFATARAAAQASAEAHRGAGSLHYVGRFELIEFAITLEPQEPLRIARKILFAGMNALADALALLAPPEKPIGFHYPGALHFDGALIGGGRIAWPERCGVDETPDWLVFGAMVRAGGVRDQGMGLGPGITTLDDEGFMAWNPAGVSASFSRQFLVEVDNWLEKGMREIGPRYLSRLETGRGAKRRGIDENGDLLIDEGGGAPRRIPFPEGPAAPEWRDPETGEPRG
jgi:hypothetical protein